jgi:hypothetical protein
MVAALPGQGGTAPLSLVPPNFSELRLGEVRAEGRAGKARNWIFIAALNGSALGLGAELAWACDLRVMADGDFFIGHPEVLLGINQGVAAPSG